MKTFRLFLGLSMSFVLATSVTFSYGKPAKNFKDTITLLSFNDFHGSFQQTGNIPGAGRLAHSLLSLKNKVSHGIVVSCGDNYSGGYFPRMTGGRPLKTLFDCAQVEYSAIGNHEFDWGIEAMVERFHWSKTQYLAANIFTDSLREIRPDWAVPYAIKRIRLNNGKVFRVAFIGLASQETSVTALPSIVKHLSFADPVRVAKQWRERLNDSADLFILLTHIGTAMAEDKVVFTDKGVDELSRIEGIHAILSGHSHKSVYGLRDGIPVVQAQNYGRKFARLQYEVSQDRKGNFSLRFLDGDLPTPQQESLAEMDSMVDVYLKDERYGFSRVLTENVQELDPAVYEPGTKFSRLGALVTTAYRDCYRQLSGDTVSMVLGVCNAGAIRTILPQGKITKLQAGNVIPFGGVLRACRLSGVQVRELLQYGLECKAGWLQYHNMEIALKDGRITAMTYVENGKRTDLTDEGSYIVVTENFVTSGGDGYNPQWFALRDEVFEKIPNEERNPTDVFIRHLDSLPAVDASQIAVPKVME